MQNEEYKIGIWTLSRKHSCVRTKVDEKVKLQHKALIKLISLNNHNNDKNKPKTKQKII